MIEVEMDVERKNIKQEVKLELKGKYMESYLLGELDMLSPY